MSNLTIPARILWTEGVGRRYAALLRDHIDKEDTILYPLAELVIPETMRAAIQEGYLAAEAQVAQGFGGQYAAVVARYELEV
jgi:hemerythrin-like domain-containing protein